MNIHNSNEIRAIACCKYGSLEVWAMNFKGLTWPLVFFRDDSLAVNRKINTYNNVSYLIQTNSLATLCQQPR